MSRFLARVGVGAIVSFPVVCLIAGGIQDCLGLIVMSIVCTAGVALVAWVPMWWLVGWATIASIQWIHERASKIEKAAVRKATAGPGGREFALKNYLQRASAAGMEQEEMGRLLRLNGWDPVEVQTALRNFSSSNIKAHP